LASLVGASLFGGLLALPEVFDRRKWRKEEGTTRSSRTSRALSSSSSTPTWSKRERERDQDLMKMNCGMSCLDSLANKILTLLTSGSSPPPSSFKDPLMLFRLSLSLALCV
jgi:hypothetical protein